MVQIFLAWLKVWPTDFCYFLYASFIEISFLGGTKRGIDSGENIKLPFSIILFKQVQ